MNDHRDALAATLSDGIDFDGLEVRPEDDGVAFATDDGSETVVHEDDLGTALDQYHEYVTNWYFWHAVAPQADDCWAFLRWVEDAERDGETVPDRYDALATGRTRTWGQLHVTVELAESGDPEGDRRYHLRHEDDERTPEAELTEYEDPLDARSLAKHDDDGRYRPLKTAPSLRTGWQFRDLDAGELVDAVGFFYPASIANWHRERENELDVTHWTDAAARQTGIYGVVETWDRQEGHEHINWVAEACCVDSQCVKRREWEYDDETDLDVDGGDGAFPCREPCSLVFSAARTWTKIEGEQSRTYEFELTPSEKEQVETIIDAVAEGRTGEIRDGDTSDPANRYRARFLRAKRFDDDGTLCGVPTEDETRESDG